MVERDCNTCRFNIQANPISDLCAGCLRSDGVLLPNWEPAVDSYMAAIEERHPATPYPFPDDWDGTGRYRTLPQFRIPSPKGAEPYMKFKDEPVQQFRKESLMESFLNVFSGFILSYVVWVSIATPLFNIPVNYLESFWITVLFTAIHQVRTSLWTRWRKAV